MTLNRLLQRQLTCCLVTTLLLPVAAIAAPLPTAQEQQERSGSVVAKLENTSALPEQPVPQQAVQPSQQPHAPVGTAVAPDATPEGSTASTPAGAAIAPAKQRRVSKFAIRTALVIGAVVAIGVVAGASLASSSRPPQ